MDSRLTIVRTIIHRRNELADEIRLAQIENAGGFSKIIVRSLLSALARSIGEGTSESVCGWARIVRAQHPPSDILALLTDLCQRIAGLCEKIECDQSSLIVFLEIAKVDVAGALDGDKVSTHVRQREQHSETIRGVLAMLRARDEATCDHSYETGAWCRRLSIALDLPKATVELIVKAGVLHDIGKIATPDSILFKPGPLDEDEWREMRHHAAFGAEILREIPTLAACATIVRAHHERFDGAGYPDGLRGNDIPFEARVVAVADAFHAMISTRPYRAAIPQRDALKILSDGAGSQWDPVVVDAMLRMLTQTDAKPSRAAALK